MKIRDGMVGMNSIFRKLSLVLILGLFFSKPLFAEVEEVKILAKPIGCIKVKPLYLLECVMVWTNYGGARLDFRGMFVRGGYGMVYSSLHPYYWKPFLGALKRAYSSNTEFDSRIPWNYEEGHKDRDPIDVKVMVTPAGRYYELTLYSQLRNDRDTVDKITYKVSKEQLAEIMGWMESALQQEKEWPKRDPNPWGDTT